MADSAIVYFDDLTALLDSEVKDAHLLYINRVNELAGADIDRVVTFLNLFIALRSKQVSNQAGVPSTTPTYLGEINIDITNSKFYISIGTSSSSDWLLLLDNSDVGGLNEVGTIKETASPVAPINHVLSDGSSYSRISYASLFGNITEDKGEVTITEENPGVVTLASHGLATGQRISLTTDGTLPTNLSEDTNYFVHYVGSSTFQLATTLADALAGTTIDTSGSVQSGVHSLLYCPWGIDGSSNFLVPDLQGVSRKMIGNQTVNTRTKDGPLGLGVLDEDQGQGHWHAKSSLTSPGMYDVTSGGGVREVYILNDAGSVSITPTYISDGTNGPPRIGTHVKDTGVGVYCWIRYQ